MCQAVLCQTLGTSLGVKDTVPGLKELVLFSQLGLQYVTTIFLNSLSGLNSAVPIHSGNVLVRLTYASYSKKSSNSNNSLHFVFCMSSRVSSIWKEVNLIQIISTHVS